MGVQDRDWYWKDRERKERARIGAARNGLAMNGRDRARPAQRGAPSTFWIVLMILTAIMTASNWRASHVRELAEQRQREDNVRAQELARQAAEAEAARQEGFRAAADLKASALAQRTRAEEASRRAVAKAAARREEAWSQFYHRPAHCEAAPTVECANDFIRARRQFEQRFPMDKP